MNRNLAVGVLILGVVVALLLARCAPSPSLTERTPLPPVQAPDYPPPPRAEVTPPSNMPDSSILSQDCAAPVRFVGAAQANRVSLETVAWAPFGRAERGWRTYAPFVAATVGTDCPADSPRFAEALASWADRNGLRGDGVLDPAEFAAMKNAAHALRPFVSVRAQGVCPNAPDEARLVTVGPSEGYRGKAVQMRPAVLRAYRQMVEAARRDLPELARQDDTLDVFSGYRSPAYDAARCAREGNCQGITRAKCSPHRTGLALDIVVGQAPGHPVDSTDDANRRAMSETAAYQWLTKNARRYGFVNYVFEPWHWEYVEEPV